VYRGRHIGTGEIVAVKLMDQGVISSSHKIFINLQREIQAMERVVGE
jgi:hypothetical protein